VKAAATRALSRKHAGTVKHHAKAKHTPTAHKKAAAAHKQVARRAAATAKAAKARALSLGGVSCCTAEALAASLRLAGQQVSDADVLDLYKLTADGPDAAASVWRTLEAAYVHGLGGVRPVGFAPVSMDDPAAVILGLDLPEAPHTVTLDPSGGVWSWGGLYDLTGEAVIEEAWAVTWP
jgi:hypothetical protein